MLWILFLRFEWFLLWIKMTNLNHLRPRGKAKSGEMSLSDLLICPALFPIALCAGTSVPSVLSSSLTLSSWIVYLLDYRTTGSQTGFPFSSFLPAWLCIATSSDLTTSRFRLYLSFWTVLLYRPLFNKIITKFSKRKSLIVMIYKVVKLIFIDDFYLCLYCKCCNLCVLLSPNLQWLISPLIFSKKTGYNMVS